MIYFIINARCYCSKTPKLTYEEIAAMEGSQGDSPRIFYTQKNIINGARHLKKKDVVKIESDMIFHVTCCTPGIPYPEK